MERHKKSLLPLVFASLAVFTCSAFAVSGKEAKKVEEKLQQVALFKNGLGFFTSEVVCPDKKDTFSFVPAVAAAHGTFWVAYPPKVKLESIVAKEVEIEEQKDAIFIKELLKANLNKKVELSLYPSEKEESSISGVLTYVAEDRLEEQSNPYGPGSWGYSSESYNPYGYLYRGYYSGQPAVSTATTSSLVMLKTDTGEVALDSQQIKKVQFPGGDAEKTITTKKKSMQLHVRMKKSAGGEKLSISYLAKGITWAPSYAVDIADNNQVVISAKAVVINEACDLNDVTIQLITGFPHLQFSDVFSPLFFKENLSQFLQSLINIGNQRWSGSNVMSNVTAQQSARYREGDLSGVMPTYSTAEEGKTAEDLFLYPVEHVKLAKKEVGYLPLFTESAPYKHIYTWDIPDYIDEENRYRNQQDNRGEEKPEEVWHCLKIENTAKVPWTTAPAEVLKEGIILGQDTLFYTPPKGKTTLKVTQAVSVKAEQGEFETNRKRNAADFYGRSYDLVTINGKLSVTNFKSERITLEITKMFSGEVTQSQPEAKIETLAKGLKRVNPVKKLSWTIDLDAGGSAQLEYTYEVYVHL
jgi:hypothetical protein